MCRYVRCNIQYLFVNSPVVSNPVVGFHTRFIKTVSLGPGQTVVFHDLITNNGKGYNIYTGHFQAPVDGMYYFVCSFTNLWDKGAMDLAQYKKNNLISKGYTYRAERRTVQ